MHKNTFILWGPLKTCQMKICRCEHLKPRRGFAYCVFWISHFVLPSPLVGRNNIGRRSSVHAVRARPLLIIKNIEPDELREEADTILTRGVNPESLPAPGLRPALYTSVGLVVNANAPTPRARGCFLSFSRGLRPCLSYFAPMRRLSNSAGIRPRGLPHNYQFVRVPEFLEMPKDGFILTFDNIRGHSQGRLLSFTPRGRI